MRSKFENMKQYAYDKNETNNQVFSSVLFTKLFTSFEMRLLSASCRRAQSRKRTGLRMTRVGLEAVGTDMGTSFGSLSPLGLLPGTCVATSGLPLGCAGSGKGGAWNGCFGGG